MKTRSYTGNGQEDMKSGPQGQHIPITHFQASIPPDCNNRDIIQIIICKPLIKTLLLVCKYRIYTPPH